VGKLFLAASLSLSKYGSDLRDWGDENLPILVSRLRLGDENCSISDDFGDETDTTFIPITRGVALGCYVTPLWS
jgi:hypothetical protein